MRKNDTRKISELLPEYIEDMDIGRKLSEVDIVNSWEEILGKVIKRYTGKIYISHSILYVQITSPVVKSELIMMREDIRNCLNAKAGREIVTEIKFI